MQAVTFSSSPARCRRKCHAGVTLSPCVLRVHAYKEPRNTLRREMSNLDTLTSGPEDREVSSRANDSKTRIFMHHHNI
jgi:hypothetical protein